MDFAFKSGSNSCTCCSSAILQKGEKVLVKELYLLHCIFKWSTAPCGYCVLLNFDTRNYWNRGCTVTKNIKLWLVLWTDETEFEIFIYSRRQEGTTKILQEKVQHCTVFFPILCLCLSVFATGGHISNNGGRQRCHLLDGGASAGP